MSEGLLIILIESVIVLLAGGSFLAFKAHKKRELERKQLTSLLRKLAGEGAERKEKLASTFKGLGVADHQAEESANALVDAEANCIKKFIEVQLNQAGDDVAFFSDVVYELSAEHMRVNMLNAESEIPTASPVPDTNAIAETEPEVDQEPEANQEPVADGLDEDDIEVSLDIDELEEIAEPEELNVEPDVDRDSALTNVETVATQEDEVDDGSATEAPSNDEPENEREEKL